VNPLVRQLRLDCSPEHAFSVWAERTSLWWPASHSVSGAPEAVVFEPRAGGRIFERAPGGVEHDWGRVLAWEPPRRLVYSWHLRQDRADATEVEITFEPVGDGTAVTITHRGWERLGAKGEQLRERTRAGGPACCRATSARRVERELARRAAGGEVLVGAADL
jgi:uncharacterized protein YndB with AHSA1/START domain